MVRTYDPAQVKVIIGGNIIQGFPDGAFINAQRSNQTFTKRTGVDGFSSRSKSNDRSGMITLTLAQESPSNDVLSAIAILDETASEGVVPVLIEDFFGTTLLFSEAAWIQKPPDVEFAGEVGTREWVFDCSDMDVFVGGNNVSTPS